MIFTLFYVNGISFLHEYVYKICVIYTPLSLLSLEPVHKSRCGINTLFLYPLFFQTLLDLGVSPNLKDSRSLTPLYYTVSHCTSPSCVEMLLQERAFIGSQDEQGWFEIHHVRRLLLWSNVAEMCSDYFIRLNLKKIIRILRFTSNALERIAMSSIISFVYIFFK